jgi:putative MATE family efflux protein
MARLRVCLMHTKVDARTILRLAVPALGALAAEPLYVLVDTVIVGHLGSTPLAGLAVASTLLATLIWLTNFLEYGTTGASARLFGAGRERDALDVGVQATWLAVGVGLVVTVIVELAADPALSLIGGGNADIHQQALSWIRIAALGAPFVCVTLAGQGWLRGVQDTVTPMVVVIAGNCVSAALAAGLVYGAHMGIRGSAIANAAAQSGSAVIFVIALGRRGVSLRPSWVRMREQLGPARDLSVRTVAFLLSFSTATSVAARMGQNVVAAHQIAIQLWGFLALVLDSLAIAAQALIGAAVGAGAISTAQALTRRLLVWGALLGAGFTIILLAGWTAIPHLFTSDQAVVDASHSAWPYLALMQPGAGALFALDGVFIGAGDVAFMRNITVIAGLLVYLPLTLLAYAAGFGLAGVWFGLTMFVTTRLIGGLIRARGTHWYQRGLAEAQLAAG